MTHRASMFGLAAALLLPATAHPGAAEAQVTLPDGQVVPVDSMNGEVQLYSFFASRSEGVDWITSARATPDTFSPLCDFTAALMLHEAGSSLAVGWYNVIPGASAPPLPADIYSIVPAGAAVGTTITGADIRGDARYLGGLIGFALVRTPPHYTEARWNTVCDSGGCAGTPGPWILSLSYLSTVTPNAWYVAFEDGDTSSSSWNNDGDYNDYVFFFTGITCAGAGEPCTVPGAMGICANGLTECGTGGALSCRMVNAPGTEACDGVDNDCDGSFDEGDALCGATEVCSRGQCVGPCMFEFGCPDPADACEDGLCVDAACVGMTCGPGLACIAGTCVAPCDGVSCPGELVCRGGRCLDACVGVTCAVGQVCEGGVCVEGCGCRACGAGRECDAASGACVDMGCSGMGCGAGQVCRAGACVDACSGAICPRGQTCSGGACVEGTSSTMDGGASRDGATGDGSASGDGGDAGRGSGVDGGCACGCSVGGVDDRRAAGGAVLFVLAVMLRRRRRSAARQITSR